VTIVVLSLSQIEFDIGVGRDAQIKIDGMHSHVRGRAGRSDAVRAAPCLCNLSRSRAMDHQPTGVLMQDDEEVIHCKFYCMIMGEMPIQACMQKAEVNGPLSISHFTTVSHDGELYCFCTTR
jgi:hypothetical protein